MQIGRKRIVQMREKTIGGTAWGGCKANEGTQKGTLLKVSHGRILVQAKGENIAYWKIMP